MSAFGKEVEITDGAEIKLYTGVENFKVVALNPSKEEMEEMYGREINFTPEYTGEVEVEDSDGKRKVKQIRLDFFLANEDSSITTKLQFYVSDTHHRSSTGKLKCINSFGADIWLEKDAVDNQNLPDNLQWYNADGVKISRRGEIELISFLVNLLNLPYDLSKVSDVSDAYAKINDQEWKTMINQGDVSLLRNIIANTNNKIGVLLGVKTNGEGKLRQTTLNRTTFRQFVLSSKKATKYKFALKDLESAKANGALGNVDFGSNSLLLQEHVIEETVITDENTNQTDIFGTDEPELDEENGKWLESEDDLIE
jgi:hypothetical protein